MNIIRYCIDQQRNIISVWYNGTGIPIRHNIAHNMFEAELTFGKIIFTNTFRLAPPKM
jgi:hypothetical protein